MDKLSQNQMHALNDIISKCSAIEGSEYWQGGADPVFEEISNLASNRVKAEFAEMKNEAQSRGAMTRKTRFERELEELEEAILGDEAHERGK